VALGVPPVAIPEYPYSVDGRSPWSARKLGSAPVKVLDITNGAPLERIAALEPDVILAAQHFAIDSEYDKLARIAPVLAYRGEQLSYGYEQHTLDAGRALGHDGRARESVAGVAATIREIRAEHPEF